MLEPHPYNDHQTIARDLLRFIVIICRDTRHQTRVLGQHNDAFGCPSSFLYLSQSLRPETNFIPILGP